MKLKSFIEGLNILSQYFDDPDGYHIGSEHDIFYVYATSKPVSGADVTKLRELGWFQSDVLDGEPYDPAEGWAAWT